MYFKLDQCPKLLLMLISSTGRCNISVILMEMDRILRPGGIAYIRDSKFIMDDIQAVTKAMGWRNDLQDTAEGPYASRKILMCQKPMVHS